MNILIVKLSAIGDVIHTLPSLAALRRCYPQAHISWVVEEAAADLLADHPMLDRVLVSRRKRWMRDLREGRSRASALREIREFLRALRDRPYDLVIDFHGLFKSAVLVFLSGGKRRLGYDSLQEGSGLVLNERIPEDMNKHAVDRYLDLPRHLGCETGEPEFPSRRQGLLPRNPLTCQPRMRQAAPRRARNGAPEERWETPAPRSRSPGAAAGRGIVPRRACPCPRGSSR